MPPKRAVITYVSHRLHSSPSTAREQSLRLVHLCTILRVVLRRRSLSAIPLDPTAQAFLYACPATGCIAAPVFINISRESPSRRPYVGPPCQWILNLLCYHVGIAFTEFINWRRLNIEQSYGLRAPYLDGAYCLTQCTVAKKYHVLKTTTVYSCSINGNQY